MQRHYPHLLALAKWMALIGLLTWLAASGTAQDVSSLLSQRFYSWSWLVYPAAWLFFLAASLLIVFPFTLLEDHHDRSLENIPDDMPWHRWVSGFAQEWLIGAALGSALYGLMIGAPGIWWWLAALIWTGYHAAQPFLLSWSAMTESANEESPATGFPELLTALKDPLDRMGVELSEVSVLAEEDETMMFHSDVLLARSGSRKILLVPHAWAHQWTIPELVAVTLHKIYLDRPLSRGLEMGFQFLTALMATGGYVLLFPGWSHLGGVERISDPASIPLFMGWIIGVIGLCRIPAFALSRRWIERADTAVVEQMGTHEGLLAALERAQKENPPHSHPPAWANILFANSPLLSRRIARIREWGKPGQ